ncbi:Transketolase [Sulfidibacter corallicola]|uniref:Transketolase n=1 Tax=Sulfidibacter corallicola TaxID=2818388 RepID=A0A8A4TVX2_SULCO|nr:transketolase [Sulfidibacter corallicola]QTD53507.1 transketolase [Sulfidibacter corallicola]
MSVTPVATASEQRRMALHVRRLLLAMIYHAGSGYPGGALSATDILVHLYSQCLATTAEAMAEPDRPRFVLSKGHACAALYAVAALKGLLPLDALTSFRKINGTLQGHPHVKTTPFVEASTGSLGQGFSVAVGMAVGYRHHHYRNPIFAMLGDGELQEGQVWEAAMLAGHYQLDRLCVFIDYNKLQRGDLNQNIIGLEPLLEKWRAFGWQALNVDGHDFEQLEMGVNLFMRTAGVPTVLVAHTIKGKGVRYMEGVAKWHGSVCLSSSNLRQALLDLNTDEAEIPAFLDGSVFAGEAG